MAPLFPSSVRDPGMLGREDVRQLLKKKALIRAARDKRLAALKAAGAGAADIVRLHFAFQEAKRFATDR